MPLRAHPFLRFIPTALILIGALAVYLVGLGDVPLIDRDEPRYATASRQMLETGNWVVPYFLDEVRLKKPPLIYWAQAASMKVFGPTVFAARLPSALAFVATLLLLAMVLPREIGLRRTNWALFMLATSVLSLWAAKTCLTDGVLIFWITVSQLCLYQIWRGRRSWPVMVVLGVAIGLSLLTKGPVALMFMGMTALVMWVLELQRVTPMKPAPPVPLPLRDGLREAYVAEPAEQAIRTEGADDPTLPRVVGPPPTLPAPSTREGLKRVAVKLSIVLASVLVITLPWVIALELKRPGAIREMLGTEVIARGSSAQEGHSGPPGFYLLSIVAMWFPWSLLLPAALWQGWRHRRRVEVRFALASVVGPWLFLEIYKTKLPHYLLPAYPFLAILTADMLVQAIRGRIGDLLTVTFLFLSKALAVVLAFIGAATLVLPWLLFGSQSWPFILSAWLLVLAYPATGFGAAFEFARLRPARACLVLGLGTWLICVLSWGLYFPYANFLDLSPRAAQVLKANGAIHPGDVRMADYKEPSLAFYQGGTIREESDLDLLKIRPSSAWPRWLVTTRAHWNDQSEWTRDRWEVIHQDRGLNVAEARIEDVVIVRYRFYLGP